MSTTTDRLKAAIKAAMDSEQEPLLPHEIQNIVSDVAQTRMRERAEAAAARMAAPRP